MQNGIKSIQDMVEGTVLETNHGQLHCPTAKGESRAHLSNIRYDGKLELVTVVAEELFEVGPFRFRPEGSSDGVTLLEEGIDDVDGGEAVCAGDEDFASWCDSWHGLLLFRD